MSQLLRELNEVMQVKYLAQFQAYNKLLINVTCATKFRWVPAFVGDHRPSLILAY